MRRTIVATICCLLSVCMYGQLVPWGMGQEAIKGGRDGKNYAVIISTQWSKKELVEKIANYVVSKGWTVPEAVKADEINESTSEYIIRLKRLVPMRGIGVMGQTCPPFELLYDLRFEFHDNGKVMLVYENMSTNIFIAYWTYALTVGTAAKSANELEYFDEMVGAAMDKNLFVRVLGFGQYAKDDSNDAARNYPRYGDSPDVKAARYARMEEANEGKWMTIGEFCRWFERQGDRPGGKYMLAAYRKYEEDGCIPPITQKFWERSFRYLLDQDFQELKFLLEGTIEGVAEDGVQTWEVVEGRLLPTDAKLQKKYLKKMEHSYYNPLR